MKILAKSRDDAYEQAETNDDNIIVLTEREVGLLMRYYQKSIIDDSLNLLKK